MPDRDACFGRGAVSMGCVGAKLGRRIISESVGGKRNVLVFPSLERVAPDTSLLRVQIQWTERELQSLAKRTSAGEANRPTEALIPAMRD